MFLSYPLLAAILGMFIAQFVKIPIHFFISKELNWKLFFSTGGMPSSHTSTIISLTTAIGMTSGFYSNEFAICVVVSAIVIYDAMGVRRQAGFHAEILNRLLVDFNRLIETIKDTNLTNTESKKKLKELLGHEPIEVFFGIITGILVGLFTFYFYPF